MIENKTKEEILKLCNSYSVNTLMQEMGIEFVDFGEYFLTAKMPVTPKVHQPMGLLHGGATAAIAETVGSLLSMLFVDTKLYEIRGIELSANHLRSKKDGFIYATANLIHRGKTIHLCEIKVTDEEGKLISLCKLSNIVLEKKPK